MKEVLQEIINILGELPEIIESHPFDVAFSLGKICSSLQIIVESLENQENQRHGC